MAESIKQTVEDKARQVAEPILQAEGLELIDVEYTREHGDWVLRLFIDKPGQTVGLDDCEKGSKAVETALDVEDVVPHAYSLQVSSPGIDRPLRKPQHFEKALGQKVKVKTFGPLTGVEPPRKNFGGVLKGVEGDAIKVSVEGAGEFRIPFKDIAKANLDPEF
ncbi:MAG: ribosome maturation factor RimP [Myxococcaceae bacterium]